MPKGDDLARIRAELRAERAAKSKKNMPWVVGTVLVLGVLLIGILVFENTPDARLARTEANQIKDRQRRIDAETEKSYRLFKDAEELQKMRPLNAVEERVLRDQARKAAEAACPK